MTSDHVGILISDTVVEVLAGEGGARANLSAGMVRETMNRVVMRKPPLVNFVPRFAAKDTPLGNYTIREGDPVWVSSAAAHADPVFADHAVADTTISTRAHLAWGAGRRQCPARELASTVAAAGVSRLFERFSHLELALPVDQPPWRSSPFMRGLRSLPVRYELAQPVAPLAPEGRERAGRTGVRHLRPPTPPTRPTCPGRWRRTRPSSAARRSGTI
ncbi:cytochrome P450 [Streptomyces sp. NPDC090798]|uniref:cytochrome P450 n=1 Tax=Streptomyces sp. NPDC090798 TaxID=3365968 RepID=UPI00382FF9FD